MSIRNKAAIVGIGETPTDRLGSKPGEPRKSSAEYVSWAMRLALEDAGLSLKDFNGQGLGVTIPTAYPQPFWPEEVAEILGITPGFLLGGATGGAGSVSLLGGMAAAINSGLIDVALCVGAAAPFSEHFGGGIQPGDMRDWEIPYGTMGPNSKIAMVMRRHMHEYGTTLDHLGKIAVAGRYHASLNPAAYLRKPITDRGLQRIPGWWPIRFACLTASSGKRRQSLHLGVTGTREEAAQASRLSQRLRRAEQSVVRSERRVRCSSHGRKRRRQSGHGNGRRKT